MTDVLPFTGERFTPECEGEIWLEHWHRYIVAARFCQGKRVLDAACGEGYGSAYLSRFAERVCGVDANETAIAHARTKYQADLSLTFESASVNALPFPDASFDLVVSFETIEHLVGQEAMLREFRRVLSPDGMLLLSSPNRPIYSQNGAYRNPFHVRELDKDELSLLLKAEFPRVSWYAQRVALASVIWSLEGGASEDLQVYQVADGAPEPAALDPVYYLVIATGAETHPDKAMLASTFADSGQSAYKEYVRIRHEYYVQRAELAEVHGRLAALRQELEGLRSHALTNGGAVAAGNGPGWFRRLLARIGMERSSGK